MAATPSKPATAAAGRGRRLESPAGARRHSAASAAPSAASAGGSDSKSAGRRVASSLNQRCVGARQPLSGSARTSIIQPPDSSSRTLRPARQASRAGLASSAFSSGVGRARIQPASSFSSPRSRTEAGSAGANSGLGATAATTRAGSRPSRAPASLLAIQASPAA